MNGLTTGRRLALAAVGWSVLVIIGAAALPIETVDTGRAGEQPRYSLVHEHGFQALIPAALPLFVCVLVTVLVYRNRNPMERACAWALAVTLTLAALVGTVTFLIGIYVLPAAGLLIAAVAQCRQLNGPKPIVKRIPG